MSGWDAGKSSQGRWRTFGPWGWSLVWGAVAACVAAWMAPLEPSFLEEGLMLHVAERLVGGEHLYRDALAVTGPVPYEMLAQAFRLFGAEVAVARFLIVALQALSTALVFDWVRRSGAGPLAHAAAACLASAPVLCFPLYTLFFYTTVAFHFCILAGYASVRLLASERVAWGIAAGVLIAMAALSKQTLGAALAVTLAIVVLACAAEGRRLRALATVAAGGILVAVLTLTFYLVRGELGVVFDALVVRPFSLGETFTSPYMNLWPIGEFTDETRANRLFYVPQLYNLYFPSVFSKVGWGVVVITQLAFALPLFALAATALARVFHPLRAGVWVNGALLVTFFANLYPRSDWGHLVVVLPVAVVQLLLVFAPRPDAARAEPSARSRLPARLVSAALVLVFAVSTGIAGQAVHALSVASHYGPRVPQRPVSIMTRNAGAGNVVRFLNERVAPGEAIFVARSEPLVYFATGTTNPTPFGGVLTGHREEQERILLPALEKVRFVVMSDRDQPLYTYYSDEVPAVQAFLERHFEVPAPFIGVGDRDSWIYVLQRADDRGPAWLDFFDAREEGRYWIRDVSGQEKPAPKIPPRLAAHYNRRPLAMRMGLYGGGVDFDLRVPQDAVFQGDIGLKGMTSKDNFFTHPPKSRLVVEVRRQGERAFERLHEEAVLQRSFSPTEGKFWTPVEVDLSAYAGDEVTLRMAAESDHYIKPGELAWFGSPRIVRRSDVP